MTNRNALATPAVGDVIVYQPPPRTITVLAVDNETVSFQVEDSKDVFENSVFLDEWEGIWRDFYYNILSITNPDNS